ncbi:inorganic diphosphatase [Pseudomonas sp. ERGC3:05]|nr:inorganic diphosphatase [Pseudomonas sp. ERGC3:01]QZC93159.1 inorganic diphosphatase [Pseudomonas sp. ERGC3:05]
MSDDVDPLGVLVICLYPVSPGVVIRSRPVGVMSRTDEAGADAK